MTFSIAYPSYRSPLATWLATFPWTYAYTLRERKTPGVDWANPSLEQGLALRALAESFYNRLSRQVYGRKVHKQAVVQVTFFERCGRGGNSTCWHGHSLVWINPDFDQGQRVSEAAWRVWRQKAPGELHIDRLPTDRDARAMAHYITKFDHVDGIEPLLNLPVLDDSIAVSP